MEFGIGCAALLRTAELCVRSFTLLKIKRVTQRFNGKVKFRSAFIAQGQTTKLPGWVYRKTFQA